MWASRASRPGTAAGRAWRAWWAAILMLAAVVSTPILVGVLAVQIQAGLGIGDALLGLCVTAFWACTGLSAVIGGRLIDRAGWRRAALAGLTVSLLSQIGVATSGSAPALLAWLVVAGLGYGVVSPASNLVVVKEIPARLRGTALGAKQSATPVVARLAGLAVPLVALTIGWQWAFAMATLLTVAAATVSLPPRPATPTPPPPKGPVPGTGDGPAPRTPVPAGPTPTAPDGSVVGTPVPAWPAPTDAGGPVVGAPVPGGPTPTGPVPAWPAPTDAGGPVVGAPVPGGPTPTAPVPAWPAPTAGHGPVVGAPVPGGPTPTAPDELRSRTRIPGGSGSVAGGSGLGISLVRVSAIAGFGTVAIGSLTTFTVSTLTRTGIDVSTAGLIISGTSLASLGVRLGAGRLADRRGSDGFRPAAAMILACAAGTLAMASGVTAITVAGAVVAFCGAWGWPALLLMGVLGRHPERPGVAGARFQLGTALGAATGPLLFAGVSGVAGQPAAWLAVTACTVTSAALVPRRDQIGETG
ncbi:MFS transporter [Nonomuraea sp. NPDC048826]|uniref:MFS transporter n=1 Tax=Nonomuraea sp. NPDC048826 TaxID=3364347 RepID=UPI00371F7EFA